MHYYPALFLFSTIPSLYRPPYALPDRNRIYHPINGYSYQNYLHHLPNYSFRRTTFPGISQNNGFGKRADSDSIIFPSENLPFQRQPNDGSNRLCFMSDGRTGTCVKIHLCSKIIQTAAYSYSPYLTHCGYTDAIQEICCPASLANFEKQNLYNNPSVPSYSEKIKPKTKPGTAIPNKKVAPSKQQNNYQLPINEQKVNKKPSTSIKDDSDTKVIFENPSESILDPNNLQGYNFSTPEADQVCGLFKSSNPTWPWMVSIGQRHFINNTLEWICLGSLITKEYILTTAHCLQRSPNVVMIGNLKIGVDSLKDSEKLGSIRSIAEILQHPKYRSSASYKNIGLIRITNPINVSENVIPVCFPFIAGVLEIIPFVDKIAKSVGYFVPTPVKRTDEKEFGFEEYRIMKNAICAPLFANNTNQYPNGIQSDLMCGVTKKKIPKCLVTGAPLVIHDPPSNSFVVIGISTGDTTCNEFRRQIVTFTRVNSFSSWVREQTGTLPNPAVCTF